MPLTLRSGAVTVVSQVVQSARRALCTTGRVRGRSYVPYFFAFCDSAISASQLRRVIFFSAA